MILTWAEGLDFQRPQFLAHSERRQLKRTVSSRSLFVSSYFATKIPFAKFQSARLATSLGKRRRTEREKQEQEQRKYPSVVCPCLPEPSRHLRSLMAFSILSATCSLVSLSSCTHPGLGGICFGNHSGGRPATETAALMHRLQSKSRSCGRSYGSMVSICTTVSRRKYVIMLDYGWCVVCLS